MSLIPRLFDPTEGEVLLDGVSLPEYDLRELRSHMGVVPQDTYLFSESIAANIALGIGGAKAVGTGEPGVPESAVLDRPN